jgi:hypothetical protein
VMWVRIYGVSAKHRHECRRGKHECLRHKKVAGESACPTICTSVVFEGACATSGKPDYLCRPGQFRLASSRYLGMFEDQVFFTPLL